MLLSQYIIWPTLEGSGQYWSFDFRSWALSWKSIRFSCNSRIKLLTSSYIPLNINLVFTLIFLAAWVPSVYHILKLDLSSRALPFVHERPFPSYLYFLYVRDLVDKYSGAALLTMWLYGIHTGSHDLPRLFLDGTATFRIFQPSCRYIENQSTLAFLLEVCE